MAKIKLPNWLIAGANILFLIAGIIFVIVDPTILAENLEAVLVAVGTMLGVDLVPCFNNAFKTAEDDVKKQAKKELKQAQKNAKKELKAQQKQQLEALTNQKLEEAKTLKEQVEIHEAQ